MGSLISNVMMNGLVYNVASYSVLYAHDTYILTKHTSVETLKELSNNAMKDTEL